MNLRFPYAPSHLPSMPDLAYHQLARASNVKRLARGREPRSAHHRPTPPRCECLAWTGVNAPCKFKSWSRRSFSVWLPGGPSIGSTPLGTWSVTSTAAGVVTWVEESQHLHWCPGQPIDFPRHVKDLPRQLIDFPRHWATSQGPERLPTGHRNSPGHLHCPGH